MREGREGGGISGFGWLLTRKNYPDTFSRYGYYGITGNGSSLAGFRHEVIRVWRKWLSRRKRGDRYPWSRFARLLEHYPLPEVVVVHSVYRRVARP